MKVLYLDLGMGAAGDMLTAALLELLSPDERERALADLNGAGIPGVTYEAERVTRSGIVGTHMHVLVDGAEESQGDHHDHHAHAHRDHGHHHEHHHHSGLAQIEEIVQGLALPDCVKRGVQDVYALIAEAEGRVHGTTVEQVHFHEVGALDAVADVAAVCLLMERLAPEAVIASPVHVGSGTVTCAHGVMPVPAPATALLLEGVPIYGGQVRGELCTPTGAALLRRFVTSFEEMPPIRIEAVGYGMGTREFEQLNCVRALLGEMEPGQKSTSEGARDEVTELSCNVDDMTAEGVGFALEKLFEAGACDAFAVPIVMKKSRPATMVCALADDGHLDDVRRALFAHTTTLGIREERVSRSVLTRRERVLETPYGPVRVKESEGYGVERRKFEYDDLVRIARERKCGLEDVRAELRQMSEL